jgi:beta-xylosidase
VEGEWVWLPQIFDASILSDEAIMPGTANFTGNFVGMCCQDLAGTGLHADFDYFLYEEARTRGPTWITPGWRQHLRPPRR